MEAYREVMSINETYGSMIALDLYVIGTENFLGNAVTAS